MLIFPTRVGRLACHFATSGLLPWRFWRDDRINGSGVRVMKGQVYASYHAASSHGGARDLDVWPRVKVSMMIIVPPHLGHGCDWSRSSVLTS